MLLLTFVNINDSASPKPTPSGESSRRFALILDTEFEFALARFARQFEPVLEAALADIGAVAPLDASMQLAVMGGGKRFRPFIVHYGCSLFEVPASASDSVGIAVEFLHAASLVLDDLPAMDNADMRRGAPSVHRRFGEAQAILTATALIAEAFRRLASERTTPDAALRTQLIARCAQAIGPSGISGGQALDLLGSGGAPHKTADLIRFCCEAAPLLAWAPAPVIQCLSDFGSALGHIFQDQDDRLDGVAETAQSSGDRCPVHQAQEEARRLETEFGFPAEKIRPLVALCEWSKTRSR